MAGLVPGQPVPGTAGVVQAVKNAGLEGGGAALGQMAGAPFAEVGGVQLGGALGGMAGNAAAQLTSDQPFSFGQMLAAAPAAMIPGASLAKAGGKEMLAQGAKYAGANLLGANIASMGDTGKPASLGQDVMAVGAAPIALGMGKYLDTGERAATTALKTSEGAPLRSVLKDAADLNLAIPPVVSNPSLAQKAAHVVGGGSDVINAAKEINQPATVQAIRDELGFKPGEAMDLPALNAKVIGTNMVYDKIGNVSPQAAYAMQQFKENTANANKAFAAYNGSQVKIPAQLDVAKNFQADADAAANLLQQELKDKGQSSLFNEFQDSRKLRAQLELTKEAISPGGKINADVFGNAYENGRPLSGNLLKLGRVQSEFNKYLSMNPATPSGNIFGGVTKLGAGALVGYGAGGIPGAAIGALTVPPAVRAGLLSRAGQAAFTTPFYGSTAPDFAAQMAKYGALSAGRNEQ